MAAKALLGRYYAPVDPIESFAGRFVLVTGANSGLGFEAAAKFLAKGAQRVILAVRDTEKGHLAKAKIAESHGNADRMDVWQLDMNDYDSIRQFAQRINGLDHLDVAVLNAGVHMVQRDVSPHGWERTLQVNLISTTILSLLLLPKLKRSKTDRVRPVLEFVSSEVFKMIDEAKLDKVRQAESMLEAYNEVEQFSPLLHYGVSKLFLMYISQALAAMVDPSVVLVTSVCPGPCCGTGLIRGYDGLGMKLMRFLAYVILRTPEQGSRTLVSGTTLGLEGHGRFWQHDMIQPEVAILEGKDGEVLRRRVWDEVMQALRPDWPNLDKLVEEVRKSERPGIHPKEGPSSG